MRDDVPDQPGAAVRVYRTVRRIERLIDVVGAAAVYEVRRRSVSRTVVTAACLTAIVAMLVMSRPGPAWAQPVVDDILEIPVHPNVATMVRLPEPLTRSRVNRGAMRVTLIGRTVHVRPDEGVPLGLEALLEVETTTMTVTFRLRVVKHRDDARRELVVVALKPEQRAEQGPLGIEDTTAGRLASGLMTPLTAVRFAAAMPAPRAPAPPPAPPAPGPAPAPPPAESIPAAIPIAPRAPLELSVHAVGGLGFTGLEIGGYESGIARQSSGSLGIRLRGARPGALWSVEANVSGERMSGPMTYRANRDRGLQLELTGPWLRADVGMRLEFGTKWSPSVYAGPGVQAHLRRVELKAEHPQVNELMKHGAVLVLGMGLQYRVRDLLLGLDFQFRQGWPDDYRSMGVFWTVGRFLDQGE